MPDPEDLEAVLDRLEENTREQDEVEVDDLLSAFQERLLGPVVAVPAMIVVTPVGAIPLVPTIVGVLLVLVAVQTLLGSRRPWVPRYLSSRSVHRDKLVSAFAKVRPWAIWIDTFVQPRLSFLVVGPMYPVNAIVVIVFGLMMPPLELLPFAAALPAAGALLLGMAVMAKDGALLILAWIMALASMGLIGWFFWS